MEREFCNVFTIILFSFVSLFLLKAKYAVARETECYTVNGADYKGTQAQIESPITHPNNFTSCVKWKETGIKEFQELSENYCRNTNNSVFPWCFKRDGGILKFSLCDIPNCQTPAYIGCYNPWLKVDFVDDSLITKSAIILNGTDSLLNDSKMEIAKCLDYCRSLRYFYAGLIGGNSCYCVRWLSEENREQQLQNPKVKLADAICRTAHCANQPMHSCGGSNAFALYSTKAGMCGSQYWNIKHGIIYSPRWPGRYQKNATCSWKILVPPTYQTMEERYNLAFSFVYFDLEPVQDNLLFYTFSSLPGRKPRQFKILHGSNLPDDFVVPLQNVSYIFLQFMSDHKISHYGFTLKFKVEKKQTINETIHNNASFRTIGYQNLNESATVTAINIIEDENTTANTISYFHSTSKRVESGLESSFESAKRNIVVGIIVVLLLVLLIGIVTTYAIKRRRKKELTNNNTQLFSKFQNPITLNINTKSVSSC